LWEDGIVASTAVLVTSGTVHWIAAFFGLAFGIVIGDVALYAIGRFAAGLLFHRKWISPQRLARYENLVSAHTAKTVFLARLIPGTRTPTFLAVGLLKAPFWRFTFLAFTASVLQSLIVVTLSHFLGETAKGIITNRYVKIALGVLVVAAILLARVAFTKRRKKL
jgi:membrane protein DedA with SNARE-associated domain